MYTSVLHTLFKIMIKPRVILEAIHSAAGTFLTPKDV